MNDLPNGDIPDSLWITMDSNSNASNSCRTGYVNDNTFKTNLQINKENDVIDESNSPQSGATSETDETIVALSACALIDVDCVDTSTSDIQNHILSNTFLAK